MNQVNLDTKKYKGGFLDGDSPSSRDNLNGDYFKNISNRFTNFDDPLTLGFTFDVDFDSMLFKGMEVNGSNNWTRHTVNANIFQQIQNDIKRRNSESNAYFSVLGGFDEEEGNEYGFGWPNGSYYYEDNVNSPGAIEYLFLKSVNDDISNYTLANESSKATVPFTPVTPDPYVASADELNAQIASDKTKQEELKKDIANLEKKEKNTKLSANVRKNIKKQKADKEAEIKELDKDIANNQKALETVNENKTNQDAANAQTPQTGVSDNNQTAVANAEEKDKQQTSTINSGTNDACSGPVWDLFTFGKAFKSIVDDYPWYFQSVEGLSDVYKNFYQSQDKTTERVIKISMLESVDMRVSTMFKSYFNACYNFYQKKEIIPTNLRKFNCTIYIHDIKSYLNEYTYLGQLFKKFVLNENSYTTTDPKNNYFGISKDLRDIAANHLGCYQFKFFGCEFVPGECGQIFDTITNQGGEAVGTSMSFKYEMVVINQINFADIVEMYDLSNQNLIPTTQKDIGIKSVSDAVDSNGNPLSYDGNIYSDVNRADNSIFGSFISSSASYLRSNLQSKIGSLTGIGNVYDKNNKIFTALMNNDYAASLVGSAGKNLLAKGIGKIGGKLF